MSRIVARCRFSRFFCPGWALFFSLAAAACLVAAEAARRAPEGKPPHGQGTYGSSWRNPPHGAAGEGTAENCPRPLAGDRSLGQLSEFIAKSILRTTRGAVPVIMPRAWRPISTESLLFPAARVRNQPARVELSPLTVNQYANVVADLVGSLRERTPHNGPPGLKAKYTARHRQGGQVKDDPPIERIDAKIDFTFPAEGPLEGGVEPDEYQWPGAGALQARRTGEYEFNLETSNGDRLWLNDNAGP